jgi:hypothetical protein
MWCSFRFRCAILPSEFKDDISIKSFNELTPGLKTTPELWMVTMMMLPSHSSKSWQWLVLESQPSFASGMYCASIDTALRETAMRAIKLQPLLRRGYSASLENWRERRLAEVRAALEKFYSRDRRLWMKWAQAVEAPFVFSDCEQSEPISGSPHSLSINTQTMSSA